MAASILSGLRQTTIVLLCSIGFLACSLASKYSNQQLEALELDESSDVTSLQVWAGICFPAGALMGSLLSWIPLHYLGRRSTLQLLSAPLLAIGSSLVFIFHRLSLSQPSQEVPSPSFTYAFIPGICLQGIAAGLTFTAVPIYVLETTSSWNDYTTPILIAATQLPLVSGHLLATIFPIGSSTHFFHLIPAAFQVITIVGYHFVPESPRWLLLSKLEIEEAKRTLVILRGKDNPDYDVCRELVVYRLQEDQFINNFTSKLKQIASYNKTLFFCIALICSWHMCGGYAYEFYATWVFQFAGILENKRYTSIVVAGVKAVSTVMCTIMLIIIRDVRTRSILLIVSSGLVTIALSVTGACLYTLQPADSWAVDITWLPLSASMLFHFAFWLGLAPQFFIIASQLTPPPFRPSILSVGGGFYWLAEIAIPKLFIHMMHALQPFGVFWLFAGTSGIILVFITFCVVPQIISERTMNLKVINESIYPLRGDATEDVHEKELSGNRKCFQFQSQLNES